MILHRIEGSRFSEVSPNWAGETVVLIGGGPSLTREQVRVVSLAHAERRARCIAINDAYHLAPWADVLYAADARWYWWQQHGKSAVGLGLSPEIVRRNWADYRGEKCSIESSSMAWDESVHFLRNLHGNCHGVGLSCDNRALVTGRNSGFQALNLAVLAGARKIVLLGFDGGKAKDGRSHWFGDHPEATPDAVYSYFRQAMSAAENALADLGVEVLNCSPGSMIDSFPKSDIGVAL